MQKSKIALPTNYLKIVYGNASLDKIQNVMKWERHFFLEYGQYG
jgi:hypothetical protein